MGLLFSTNGKEQPVIDRLLDSTVNGVLWNGEHGRMNSLVDLTSGRFLQFFRGIMVSLDPLVLSITTLSLRPFPDRSQSALA